jgi:hypothetical protein
MPHKFNCCLVDGACRWLDEASAQASCTNPLYLTLLQLLSNVGVVPLDPANDLRLTIEASIV